MVTSPLSYKSNIINKLGTFVKESIYNSNTTTNTTMINNNAVLSPTTRSYVTENNNNKNNSFHTNLSSPTSIIVLSPTGDFVDENSFYPHQHHHRHSITKNDSLVEKLKLTHLLNESERSLGTSIQRLRLQSQPKQQHQPKKKRVSFYVDEYDTPIDDVQMITNIAVSFADAKNQLFYSSQEHNEMRTAAYYSAEDFLIDHPTNVEYLDHIIEFCFDSNENNNDCIDENESKLAYEWSNCDGRGIENIFSPVLGVTSQTAVKNILNYQEELRQRSKRNVLLSNDISESLREECLRWNEGSTKYAQLLALGDLLVAQSIHLEEQTNNNRLIM